MLHSCTPSSPPHATLLKAPHPLPDAPPNASPDALPDVPPNALPDAPCDVPPDAWHNVPPNAPPDAPPDALHNAPPDAPQDTAPPATAVAVEAVLPVWPTLRLSTGPGLCPGRAGKTRTRTREEPDPWIQIIRAPGHARIQVRVCYLGRPGPDHLLASHH